MDYILKEFVAIEIATNIKDHPYSILVKIALSVFLNKSNYASAKAVRTFVLFKILELTCVSGFLKE